MFFALRTPRTKVLTVYRLGPSAGDFRAEFHVMELELRSFLCEMRSMLKVQACLCAHTIDPIVSSGFLHIVKFRYMIRPVAMQIRGR